MSNDLAQRVDAPLQGEGAGRDAGEVKTNSEQDRSAEQLQKLQSLFAAALNTSEHGMVVLDADNRLVAHNNRFAEMYNIPAADLQAGAPGSGLKAFIPDPEPGDSETGPLYEELVLPNKKRVRVTRQALPDGGCVETHEYCNDRRRDEQHIRWLANNDPLTEVGNPLYFSQELENAIQQSRKGVFFALYWIDIDLFREIEARGETVANAVLKTVAERLVHTVRKGDLIARLGGDEFAVIQPGVKSKAQAEILADRLLTAINRPVEVGGHMIPVTVSIGIVWAPEHGTGSLELMKNIYLALYAAKAAGRHTVKMYDPQTMPG